MNGALRRIARFLGHPIWSIYMSTKSQIDKFVPAISSDPSAHINSGELQRLTAFFGLELDLAAKFEIKNVLQPLASFSTSNHMAKFGRPLWSIYAASRYQSSRAL